MTVEIDKLGWIEIKNRQLLTARSRNKEAYYIPGGKREPGEDDQTALTREINEELSVNLRPETISFMGEFRAQADGKPTGTEVKLTCYRAEYLGQLKAAAEIEEIRWITSKEALPCSPVTRIVLDWLKKERLID